VLIFGNKIFFLQKSVLYIKICVLQQEFVAENPILSEYKAKVTMFTKLETNIDDIATSEVVGPIELYTGKTLMLFV